MRRETGVSMVKKIDMIKSGTGYFKPRARLLVLLGEQLITNEIIAIVELVKNAYDADATEAKIILENVTSQGKEKIIVRDNGTGMDLDTILDVWLEPATEFRKKQREDEQRTPKFGRLPLGEKGIGRFAAHKLGNTIELVTRAEGNKEEILVEVDWLKFEKGYLDEIPVIWEIRYPEVFKDETWGTMITIENLRKTWDKKVVKRLYEKLQALNSPFLEKTDFKITLEAPEFKGVLREAPQLSEIFDKAVYLLEGKVNENGILHFDYRFHNPAFEWLKRSIKEDMEEVRDPKKFENKRKPFCGPFSVKFYVWDLDPATLGETITRVFYQNYVKPHTGIRIYRDGFRVWPYGEEDDDSFGLDIRRVNNPTQAVSRNQILGIVEISSPANSELRDKTDREGLISNREYEDFRELIIGCISVLEVERRKDKDKVDALREKKKPGDEVHRAIGGLKEKMERRDHWDTYKEDVSKIESAYNQRIREVLEPLLVSAGLGIAYILPVHEIIRNIGDMEKSLSTLIEDLKKTGTGDEITGRLVQILQTTDITNDIVRGVGKITRKGKPEVFSMYSVVRDALDITKLRLKRNNILIEIYEKEKIKIRGIKNMVITALLNLIDNSSYWLLHRGSERKIIIRMDHNNEGKPRIIVSDNGLGIKDDPSLLVQPFFTRKPDGMGLGLYIVDRIMKAHDGNIQFLFKGDEEGLLEGANIALVFPVEKEEKK